MIVRSLDSGARRVVAIGRGVFTSLSLAAGGALAQSPEPPAHAIGDIGHPTVAAARAALQARPGVVVARQDEWAAIADNAAGELWLFTPDGSSAPPVAVRQALVEADGRLRVDLALRCEAPAETCKPIVARFEAMRQAIERAAQPRSKPDPARPRAGDGGPGAD